MGQSGHVFVLAIRHSCASSCAGVISLIPALQIIPQLARWLADLEENL
jgi:hypothetical protein